MLKSVEVKDGSLLSFCVYAKFTTCVILVTLEKLDDALFEFLVPSDEDLLILFCSQEVEFLGLFKDDFLNGLSPSFGEGLVDFLESKHALPQELLRPFLEFLTELVSLILVGIGGIVDVFGLEFFLGKKAPIRPQPNSFSNEISAFLDMVDSSLLLVFSISTGC